MPPDPAQNLLRRHAAALALVATLTPACAASLPEGTPWGDYSRRQQAALLLGYIRAPAAGTCHTLAHLIGLTSEQLISTYGLVIADLEEKSALGRAFVRRGRLAAVKDAGKPGLCSSLKDDIDRGTAELLMP